MGSQSFQPLQVPQEVAAGTWLICEDLRNKQVIIRGEFEATLQVEYTVGTDDEPNPIGAQVTEPGAVVVPMIVKKIRVNTLSYTSGTPTATLSAEE